MTTRIGAVIIGGALVLFGTSLFFLFQPVASTLNSHQEIPISLTVQAQQAEFVETADHEGVSILFGGDMMFDRYIRTVMRKRGTDYPLSPLKNTLAEADLVVANLEGPITDQSSVSETSVIGARDNYFFTFDTHVAEMLKRFHVNAVNIGNNHILNFKEEGVRQTKQALDWSQVEYFGSPLAGDNRILVREIKGARIALVNYNQFVFQGKEKALADIESAKNQADVVVLYTHWGTEYVPATAKVKELARVFIDAGADVIIGSHPHVVQEHEVYHGKTIYYSLGNLVFDQYEEESTQQGLLVKMTIDAETRALNFKEIPVLLRRTGETVLTQDK